MISNIPSSPLLTFAMHAAFAGCAAIYALTGRHHGLQKPISPVWLLHLLSLPAQSHLAPLGPHDCTRDRPLWCLQTSTSGASRITNMAVNRGALIQQAMFKVRACRSWDVAER